MSDKVTFQNAIKLVDTRLVGCKLMSFSLNKNITDKLEFNLKTLVVPNNDQNKKQFFIHFEGDFKSNETIDENPAISLHTVFLAVFESQNDVDEEFLNSHFAKINATAIAFPFFRAAVAQILTISGFNPMLLPAINFAASAKQEDVKPK